MDQQLPPPNDMTPAQTADALRRLFHENPREAFTIRGLSTYTGQPDLSIVRQEVITLVRDKNAKVFDLGDGNDPTIKYSQMFAYNPNPTKQKRRRRRRRQNARPQSS